MRVLGYIAALALAVGALGAAAVYSGIYDVSATDQHLWPTYWTLRAAMERSIAVRARRVRLPPLDEAHARRDWDCYHLIGDCLRHPDTIRLPRSFADGAFLGRVSDALVQEPTVLAPRPPR